MLNYIDSIEPSWRGGKLLLRQAQHSPTPRDPSRVTMSGVVERAHKANAGVDSIDEMLFDFLGKASTLYRMLVPKSNFDFRPSSGTQLPTMVLSFGGFSTTSPTCREPILSFTSRTTSGSMRAFPAPTSARLSSLSRSLRANAASSESRLHEP